jgi:DNA-binding FadR family transcriptional regulator
MQLNKITISRAHQAVQQALEEAILSGRLLPGQQLPTEGELSEQFGVARHTVREGMRALEQSGLVKRDAKRRLCVVIPAYDALASRATRAMLMQRVTYRELHEVAIYTETCAMDLAMSRMSDELVERMDSKLGDMESAFARGKSIVSLNIQFHDIVAEGAKNRVLLMAREPVSLLFFPSVSKVFNHPKSRDVAPGRLIEAHRKIMEAVRARDRDAALKWTNRHLQDFKRACDLIGLDMDTPCDGK